MQKTFQVGQATIGLVGLDMSLSRTRGDVCLNDSAGADQVFAEVILLDYVPAATRTA